MAAHNTTLVVDSTILGSATNCLLAGSSGVFFRNDWSGLSPGQHFLPYAEFQDVVLQKSGLFEVSIGGLTFDVSGSSMSQDLT